MVQSSDTDHSPNTLRNIYNLALSSPEPPPAIVNSLFFFLCQELPECERVKVWL